VKKGITLDAATLEGLVDLCIEHEVLIEFNRKYGLPPAAMREIARRKRAKHVFSSDAHRVEELRNGTEEP
jgi:histidinol phosphatase-like PHP family hydrolase